MLREVRFVWDGDVLVHERRVEAAAAGDPVVEERTYLFEDDGFEPLAHHEHRLHGDDGTGRTADGAWFHYLNDPIGTPERLVDEQGHIATEYQRRAWGQLIANPGAKASTPIRLQGQYRDDETGLSYNRWRYCFQSELFFVTSDPYGLVGGFQAFRPLPNPLSWTDPLGLIGGRAKRRERIFRRIEAVTAEQGGDPRRTCKGQIDKNTADVLGKRWVGPGFSVDRTRDGAVAYVSSDGRRRYRGPARKGTDGMDDRGNLFSRTGVRANFETGNNLTDLNIGGATNVHIDII
ncbi:MAG: RHS repeat-associated core domain-containing protein [Myxococcota bacterium]